MLLLDSGRQVLQRDLQEVLQVVLRCFLRCLLMSPEGSLEGCLEGVGWVEGSGCISLQSSLYFLHLETTRQTVSRQDGRGTSLIC